jgi:phosphatidylcholine synthase
MYLADWSPSVNGAILLTLAALVFVPFKWVYPSRTPVLAVPTNVLAAVWAALMLVMLWQYPNVSPSLFWASWAFPVYYVSLSVFLAVGNRSGVRRT